MTYENLVKAAKKAVKPVDASIIKEHVAVEFDIEGKGEGAFYVEFTAKEVVVEPYEYYDHDFRIRCDADTSLAILKGEMSPVQALSDAKIVVEGNEGRLALLEEYLKAEVKAKAVKKAPAKKATEKKATEKKAAVKAEEKVEEPKKAAEKKAAEKKAVPKKVEKKPATTVRATKTK